MGVIVDQDGISEHPKDESVSYLIRHNVKPDRIRDFEAWLTGIEADMKRYRGYQGTPYVPATVRRLRMVAHLSYAHNSFGLGRERSQVNIVESRTCVRTTMRPGITKKPM